MLGVLERVEETAKATPPVDNKASRFGNPAFRTFYDKVQEVCVPMLVVPPYHEHDMHPQTAPSLHSALTNLPEDAIPELAAYFGEAWGNRSRIDYGSGMELNFLCWMICLERLGVVQESDHVALVIKVFWRCVWSL